MCHVHNPQPQHSSPQFPRNQNRALISNYNPSKHHHRMAHEHYPSRVLTRKFYYAKMRLRLLLGWWGCDKVVNLPHNVAPLEAPC
ncbi:hypothetical protein CEXT_49461 [Caerostris extrusa]|uniref:Uncharacterized protein n=1 Tax=Caerostris extrusa TaxID=172846 RepID=A0AAV4USS6_CAEEX|nr:hypothetical protein CEXT_49461 [Caerostris extrusa]